MTSGLPSALPRHRSCVTVSGAYVCACGHKLSLTATFSLSPPPLLRRGVGPLHSAVNPEPALAIPSRRCRSASFLPPFHADAILSATFLPPIEEDVIAIQSVGYLLYIVCDALPTPDVRCADALTPLRQSANHFTHSESAYGLGQGQVGLLSAVQAPQQKACRSVPPRHLPFALILCRHSEFPPFLWLTHLRYAPHRHHRTSPHQSPRLDKSAPRKIGAVAKVNFHVAEI